MSGPDQARTAPPPAVNIDSLSHAFRLLPSPQVDARHDQYPEYVSIIVEDLQLHEAGRNGVDAQRSDERTGTEGSLESIPQLRTTLHPYQRRAVCVMLQRETGPGNVRGGILCEDMGVGKTLECIALILATRGSVPSTPPEAATAGESGQLRSRYV